jgi:hypothetical protein
MTHEEIIELVRQMRSAQRKYFTMRTGYNLEAAKMLEARVDAAIGIVERKDEPKQPTLL